MGGIPTSGITPVSFVSRAGRQPRFSSNDPRNATCANAGCPENRPAMSATNTSANSEISTSSKARAVVHSRCQPRLSAPVSDACQCLDRGLTLAGPRSADLPGSRLLFSPCQRGAEIPGSAERFRIAAHRILRERPQRRRRNPVNRIVEHLARGSDQLAPGFVLAQQRAFRVGLEALAVGRRVAAPVQSADDGVGPARLRAARVEPQPPVPARIRQFGAARKNVGSILEPDLAGIIAQPEDRVGHARQHLARAGNRHQGEDDQSRQPDS